MADTEHVLISNYGSTSYAHMQTILQRLAIICLTVVILFKLHYITEYVSEFRHLMFCGA